MGIVILVSGLEEYLCFLFLRGKCLVVGVVLEIFWVGIGFGYFVGISRYC